MNFPPVALFAFNRPQHTQRTLSALAACKDASNIDLMVFVDGLRDESDQAAISDVLALFEQNLPFRSVIVHRAESNKGLYRSITEGISAVLLDHQEVIVVEDDLVVTPDFLAYMSGALTRYRDDQRVGCIHGYALPIEGLPKFYFLQGGDCWGWATWRDRWALFRPDPAGLIRELVEQRALDLYMDTQGIASLQMLCDRARRRNQSWAILWHASLWLAGRLTLHPGTSFVRNIGNDGSGTHSGQDTRFDATARLTYGGLPELPVGHDVVAAQAVSKFHDAAHWAPGWASTRVRRFLTKRTARALATLAAP